MSNVDRTTTAAGYPVNPPSEEGPWVKLGERTVLHLRRSATGGVDIGVGTDDDIDVKAQLSDQDWAAIVAHVSKGGANYLTHTHAAQFHNGGIVLT